MKQNQGTPSRQGVVFKKRRRFIVTRKTCDPMGGKNNLICRHGVNRSHCSVETVGPACPGVIRFKLVVNSSCSKGGLKMALKGKRPTRMPYRGRETIDYICFLHYCFVKATTYDTRAFSKKNTQAVVHHCQNLAEDTERLVRTRQQFSFQGNANTTKL